MFRDRARKFAHRLFHRANCYQAFPIVTSSWLRVEHGNAVDVFGVDGFEPDAAAYIYVIGLQRASDNSRWYYIGQVHDGESDAETLLKNRLRSHITSFGASRTALRHGKEILLGDQSLYGPEKRSHRVVGVDRVDSIFFDDWQTPSSDLKWPDGLPPGQTEEYYREEALKYRVAEKERQMAYEIAREHDTSNVLGGK